MQPMLSQRAQDYLAQLRRDVPVPVARVERMLIDQGYPAYPAWLEFHDQFAGYWEPIGGGNVAIWGIVLDKVSGLYGEPNKLYVTTDDAGAPVFISCADVHPSFDYNLTPAGKFVGPPFPSASFSIKVERNALMWAFTNAGPAQRHYKIDGTPITKLRDELLEELRPFHVPEASDKFANYYCSPDKLLLEALEVDTLKLMARPKPE